VSNFDVFKEAATYPYILLLSNSKPYENETRILYSDEVYNGELIFKYSSLICQNNILVGENRNIELKFDSKKSFLINKIEEKGNKSILSVYRGRGTAKDLVDKSKNTVISITNRQIKRYILTGEKFYRKAEQYANDFEPKILMKKICYYLEAALDKTGKINPINTVYVIKSHDNNIDLRYIAALLSSKLLSYFVRARYMSTHMRGGYIELRVFEVEKLPIVVPDFSKPYSKKNYEKILKLVDKLIETETSSKKKNQLDKQINDLVYDLYGINNDERQIIETSIDFTTSGEIINEE
jgi:hypothetical protein